VKIVLNGKNDCASFFNTAPLVQLNANSLTPAVLPATGADFFASDLLEPDKNMPYTVGAATTEGAGANAVIAYNSNAGGVFRSAFNPQTARPYPASLLGGFNGGSVQAQALMLLHELAHTLLLISPDSPAAVNAGFPSSQTNTKTISDHCAKAIQAASGH
jgi:hypothetical protein